MEKLASLSHAVDSRDPDIGLAAVGALRTLVEELLIVIGRGHPPQRRPDDLLATLGIDLGQVRQRAEATFGTDAISHVALCARPRRRWRPGQRWWPGCDEGREGSLDVSTPPRNATDEALPLLTRGTQVVVANASHVDDLWRLQPEAIQTLVTRFYDTGDIDADFDPKVPRLSPAIRLPVLAKAAAGTASAAVLGATLGVLARR